MRYRGWSLVLIFFCSIGYAYHSRKPSIKSLNENRKLPQLSVPRSVTLRTQTSARLYQGSEPATAATVNDVAIQTTILNQRTEFVLDRTRLTDESRISDEDRQRRFERARWQLLQEMIEELLTSQLAQDAEAASTIQYAADHVPGHVISWRTQYPTDEQFQRAFPQHLSTLEDFVRDTLRRAALHNYIRAQITVTQAELQAYYQDHKDEFNEYGRILTFAEAEQRGWVTRSVMGARQQQEMRRRLDQKRGNSTIVISIAAPSQ